MISGKVEKFIVNVVDIRSEIWRRSPRKTHTTVKIVRIRSYAGPYSVWMREIADQNNSEYFDTLFTQCTWLC